MRPDVDTTTVYATDNTTLRQTLSASFGSLLPEKSARPGLEVAGDKGGSLVGGCGEVPGGEVPGGAVEEVLEGIRLLEDRMEPRLIGTLGKAFGASATRRLSTYDDTARGLELPHSRAFTFRKQCPHKPCSSGSFKPKSVTSPRKLFIFII